jgi:hypothetical protein
MSLLDRIISRPHHQTKNIAMRCEVGGMIVHQPVMSSRRSNRIGRRMTDQRKTQ